MGPQMIYKQAWFFFGLRYDFFQMSEPSMDFHSVGIVGVDVALSFGSIRKDSEKMNKVCLVIVLAMSRSLPLLFVPIMHRHERRL